jgi:hypothetical protein
VRIKKQKVKFTRFHFLAIARIARDIVVGLAGVIFVALANAKGLMDAIIRFLILLNLLIMSYHLEITIYGKPK